MSPAEVAKLLAVLAVAYPGFEVDEAKHRLWCEMLADLDYELASEAVRRHIAASRWAPTIAEIREEASRVACPDALTAGEAWGRLMEAVREYGYYREREAMLSLPVPVRYVAQQIGWRHINLSTETDTLRAHFMRMFEQVQARERREALLPPALRTEALAEERRTQLEAADATA